MQFQEGERGNIANIAREPDNEMRPDRPVPSGCGQNARLRCREACPYSRYGLHPAPGIHRVLATTHHASVIEIGSSVMQADRRRQENTMGWFDAVREIEPFDELPLHRGFVEAFEAEARARPLGPLRFYTPTFRAYANEELNGCGKTSFPAFSITGGACALNCDHCQAKILEPMIPATHPAELERKVRDLVLLKDLRGFLLSGGSNRRNEVPYERYYPTIEKLKRDFPYLRIAVHTALLDRQ